MVSGSLIHVEKVRSVRCDRYVIQLVNDKCTLIWSSSALSKSEASNQLAEYHLTLAEIRRKFQDADALCHTEPAA